MADLEAQRTDLKAKVKAAREAKMDGGVKDCDSGGLWAISQCPKVRRTLKAHKKKIYSMHWVADGKHIVSASQDASAILWNGMAALPANRVSASFIMTASVLPDLSRLAGGGMDNTLTIYDLAGGSKMLKQFAGHDGYISMARWYGTDPISSSGDSTIRIWDISTGNSKLDMWGHTGDAACFEIIDNMCISGSTDKTCRLWDLRSGDCVRHYETGNGEVNCISFFPGGGAFAAGCEDGSTWIFDIASYNQIQKMGRNNKNCTAAGFSFSGRILTIGYDDGAVGMWDPFGSGGYKQKLIAHEDFCSGCQFSSDGQAMATSSYDATLKMWA